MKITLLIVLALLLPACGITPQQKVDQCRVVYNGTVEGILLWNQRGVISTDTLKDLNPYRVGANAALDSMQEAVEEDNQLAFDQYARIFTRLILTLEEYLMLTEGVSDE